MQKKKEKQNLLKLIPDPWPLATVKRKLQWASELETDMLMQIPTYQTSLEQLIAILIEFIKKVRQPPPVILEHQPTLAATNTTNVMLSPPTEVNTNSLPETKVTKKPLHSDSELTHMSTDTLPHDTC